MLTENVISEQFSFIDTSLFIKWNTEQDSPSSFNLERQIGWLVWFYHATVLFYTSWKPLIFWCFQGYRNRPVAWNRLLVFVVCWKYIWTLILHKVFYFCLRLISFFIFSRYCKIYRKIVFMFWLVDDLHFKKTL